jgi:hypothetical protein
MEKNELRHWEKKQNKVINGFLNQEYQEKSCWDMAREHGDFRSAFNICDDCIVFILRNGTTILSEKEVRSIEKRKVSCSFFNT